MPTLRDKVVAAYQVNAGHQLRDHRVLMQNVSRWQNRIAVESTLCCRFTLDALVRWQQFIHQLFIAYIQMDPSRMIRDLQDRYASSVEDKFGRAVLKHARLKLPRKLSKMQVASLLDPSEWNVIPPTTKKLAETASRLLVPSFAMKLALTKGDAEFYEYATALRNYLGHLSSAARKRLTDACSDLNGTAYSVLSSGPRDVGHYLRSPTGGNPPRAELVVDYLLQLASKL